MVLFEAFLNGIFTPVQSVAYVMRYLTFINILAILWHRTLHPYIHLGLLSTTVTICGLYLCYVYPCYIKVKLNKQSYTISGVELSAVDFVLHLLPWFFVIWRYGAYYTTHGSASALCTGMALYVYAYIAYNNHLYKLRPHDIYHMSVMGTILIAIFVIVPLLKKENSFNMTR